MNFSVAREELLKTLRLVAGVVEKRATPNLAILSHALLSINNDKLSITTTDQEIELVASTHLLSRSENFSFTLPFRKISDICRALPDGSCIDFNVENDRVSLIANKAKFTLSGLDAKQYPLFLEKNNSVNLTIKEADLKRLLDLVSFAIAEVDVRYYLNGLLLQIKEDVLSLVATDGHRLAVVKYRLNVAISEELRVILPRKTVLELARILESKEGLIALGASLHSISLNKEELAFSSKLLEGRFPEYERIIPQDNTHLLQVNRLLLKEACLRMQTLLTDKIKAIKLNLSSNSLVISAINQEQDEAEETLEVEYSGPALQLGLNVRYLLDVLGVVEGETITFALAGQNAGVKIISANMPDYVYIIMPLRL